MKKLLIAAALAGTALAGAAFAGQADPAPAGRGGGMLLRADANKDGVVSRAEFMAAAQTRFAMRSSDGNSKITSDQFMTRSGERFDKLDANHDGQLSKDEMQAARAAIGPRRGGPGGKRDMASPPPGADGAPMPRPGFAHRGHGAHGDMGARMLAKVDTNADGKISRDEMRAQSDQRFDRMDANHDGFIDNSEIAAIHDKVRGMRAKLRGKGDLPPSPPPGESPRANPGQ